MYYVYLLKCRDNSLYCGITNDLKKRFNAHCSGKGAKYTRTRLPVEMVYNEEAGSRSEALKRELQIKKLTAKEKQRLVEEMHEKAGN